MNDSNRKMVRLLISGRVQGVGYRDWMIETAVALGVDGWVRNRLDGTVEALAAGTIAAVDALVRAAWSGPAAARVTAVDVSAPAEPLPATGFSRRPTG